MDMIVAANNNGIIGNNNKLLWRIPEDMKKFQRLTMYNIVVMGRKTYESLPFGPLKTRINIVITSTPEKYTGQGKSETVVFCSLVDCEEILKKLQTNTKKRIFIIGGAEIYKYFFSRCEHVYVTRVDTDETDGVSIAPLMMELQDRYTVVNRIPSINSSGLNDIRYEFVTYKLKKDMLYTLEDLGLMDTPF